MLVFIHGGYWRSLDKSDFSFLAPAYNAQGIDVAIINYGLAPNTPLHDICLQTVRAIAWLHSQHIQLGFNPSNIIVAGHSAGGHLAAMAFCAHWQSILRHDTGDYLPANLIKKAFALSGIFDLEPIRLTPFLNDAIRLSADQATTISPVCFGQPKKGKILTMVGEFESAQFHHQSRLLHEAWPARAPKPQTMAGCNHLTICSELGDPQSTVSKALVDLIRS